MKFLNTTPRNRFLCPSLFYQMRIKPVYKKSYIVRYRRGKEVQSTEIVDATEKDVHELIFQTFKGRFRHPQHSEGYVPSTQLQVIELDNIKKQTRVSCFSYTKNGKDFTRPFAYVYNLSPREVRIELEKAIRT